MRMPILFALSAVAASAAASSTQVESSFACNPGGNQQEMNACALRDYKAADAALNQKYKAIMSRLAPQEQHLLRQQQRAWLNGRDPLCKIEAKLNEGGSIWPSVYFGCLQAETELRTEALSRWSSR